MGPLQSLNPGSQPMRRLVAILRDSGILKAVGRTAPRALLLITILCLLPFCSLASSPLFSRGYTVIPAPQQVDLKGGDFEFSSGWRLELGAGVHADDVAVESLKDGLSSRYGVSLASAGHGHAQGNVISLAIQSGSVEIGEALDKNKTALEEQAYRLELASDRIRITANAPTGLFYGVETLVQLVKSERGKLWLPMGKIVDWPDLEQRNILWVDNFHLEHVDVLKAALRQAAFYKINGFALKLNGHFQFQSAPAVVEPYALSPAEFQELTDYGLRYHLQLIPYQDGPAHISYLLKHPEYASLREYPDSNYELCTTNPDSYKLLDGMYQNYMDANKGVKYFMLSTDEPYYVGLADNDQCHEAQRAKELGSVGKMLAEFLDKAAGYLHDHGRTVLFWGEYPLKPDDIPSLPPYLVNGEVYGPEFDKAFHARGIAQMIYTPTEGEEPYFPNYYRLPSTQLFHRQRILDPMGSMYTTISFNSARKNTDVTGVIVAGWGASGAHPESFWLGYATGTSWGWHPAVPDPQEAMSSFYHLFYGQGVSNMARVYQLMSTQAEFWDSSWDSEPSSVRIPIFGYSGGVFNPRRPADDQTLPLPPVPQGEYLRLPFDWSLGNARRIQMADDMAPANAELFDLLNKNLRSVQFQKYNLEVYLAIAGLYRQNLQMLDEVDQINDALTTAQNAAAHVQFEDAVAALDEALDTAEQIRDQRNEALQNAVKVWYESWNPRVKEANGRKFLNIMDDVKDELPVRTVDMRYLVYRELILPFGQWFDQVEEVRNQYAQAHGMAVRTDKFDWADTKTIERQGQ